MAAVKRMNKISEQAENEFCREIELLARLHHRHLVALRGFCIKKQERSINSHKYEFIMFIKFCMLGMVKTCIGGSRIFTIIHLGMPAKLTVHLYYTGFLCMNIWQMEA